MHVYLPLLEEIDLMSPLDLGKLGDNQYVCLHNLLLIVYDQEGRGEGGREHQEGRGEENISQHHHGVRGGRTLVSTIMHKIITCTPVLYKVFELYKYSTQSLVLGCKSKASIISNKVNSNQSFFIDSFLNRLYSNENIK